MNITVINLIEKAEANRISNAKALRAKVENEVEEFLQVWLEEMEASGETEVYKELPLEEAKQLFSSVSVALEILHGMGLRCRRYKEVSTGFLWWKKIKPASIVLWYPEDEQ